MAKGRSYLLRVPFTIPPSELTFRASRASGPGGQHVNKAATRIEVLWDVRGSDALSAPEKERVRTKLAARLDAEGRLVVASDARRSQLQNRETAVRRLERLVAQALAVPKPRKQTKPPKAAKERRLTHKKRRGEIKRTRGPVREDE